MKIEFLTENIEKHLPLLGKNISTSSQVPILSNILLKATTQGFTIQATDLELGVEVKIPAKIIEEGEVTVPGRQLLEALASLPKDKVTLTKDKDTLLVEVRKNKIRFQTVPSDDFPTLFEDKGSSIGKYTQLDLSNTFGKILFSSAVDDTRPELTGVLLKQFDSHVEYVTTDGFRLSRIVKKNQKFGEVGDTLIFPRELVNELLALKGDEAEIFVNKSGHQIIIESADATIVGRMLHGNYPSYERVIPKNNSISVEVPRDELLQSLKVSSIFARENSNIVKCSFNKDTLKLTSSASSLGEQESETEIKKDGDDIDVTFNSKYLQDALRAISSNMAKLEMTAPHDPAVFRDESNQDFLHVVMPVRV